MLIDVGGGGAQGAGWGALALGPGSDHRCGKSVSRLVSRTGGDFEEWPRDFALLSVGPCSHCKAGNMLLPPPLSSPKCLRFSLTQVFFLGGGMTRLKKRRAQNVEVRGI